MNSAIYIKKERGRKKILICKADILGKTRQRCAKIQKKCFVFYKIFCTMLFFWVNSYNVKWLQTYSRTKLFLETAGVFMKRYPDLYTIPCKLHDMSLHAAAKECNFFFLKKMYFHTRGSGFSFAWSAIFA